MFATRGAYRWMSGRVSFELMVMRRERWVRLEVGEYVTRDLRVAKRAVERNSGVYIRDGWCVKRRQKLGVKIQCNRVLQREDFRFRRSISLDRNPIAVFGGLSFTYPSHTASPTLPYPGERASGKHIYFPFCPLLLLLARRSNNGSSSHSSSICQS